MHAIRLAIDNVLVLWRTIRKLYCASIFSSILANTKLFMERLNQALVGGGPNVEQKICVTDYRCLRRFYRAGKYRKFY